MTVDTSIVIEEHGLVQIYSNHQSGKKKKSELQDKLCHKR